MYAFHEPMEAEWEGNKEKNKKNKEQMNRLPLPKRKEADGLSKGLMFNCLFIFLIILF